MKNIPNYLSFSRFFIALLIGYLAIKEIYWLGFILSILAAFTDLWDGQFARKYKITSDFGAVLDPIMDKCYLLVVSFFLLFLYHPSYFLRILFLVWFVASWIRNISQFSAVPILNIAKIKFKVKPKPFAKWGTVWNMVVICVILFDLQITKGQSFFFPFEDITLLIISLIFIAISLLSSFYECLILITFLPRFFQILFKKHDTFN